jgi:hypothetical protein
MWPIARPPPSPAALRSDVAVLRPANFLNSGNVLYFFGFAPIYPLRNSKKTAGLTARKQRDISGYNSENSEGLSATFLHSESLRRLPFALASVLTVDIY